MMTIPEKISTDLTIVVITEWWKVYRWYETPGSSARFLSKHLNTPVSSYTQVILRRCLRVA
ncbi:hypothetical protein OESDEN_05761 [Oesophagostomum dentatum]|uniref:Uncharacterized protein n=1 Tax=Oesophagostomum dentatum TaxID=61180 RepID=A0A0B1TAL8_OESDE|nr:hypothetical protein OESDEN_05761 [Oesophagostomum dentatum]